MLRRALTWLRTTIRRTNGTTHPIPTSGKLTAAESGRLAQAYVVQKITAQGWLVIAENLHDKQGELDIVADASGGQGDIVVIEVRSCVPTKWRQVTELLPPSKQLQVTEAARRLLPRQSWWRRGLSLRFDAALVELSPDGRPSRLEYVVNAFEPKRRDWV